MITPKSNGNRTEFMIMRTRTGYVTIRVLAPLTIFLAVLIFNKLFIKNNYLNILDLKYINSEIINTNETEPIII